jgi:arginyl-tRNA--protein-N-Asp/Glu arginylyltransferase
MAPDDDDYFFALQVPPERMDTLWSRGWRHFGWYFFRYRTAVHGGREYSVLPLRIDLARFELSRGQRRVLARNRDAQVVVRDSFLDDEKHRLFARHAGRFREDAPTSLHTFLSPTPASVPCLNREIAVYLDGRLAGVTFLDIGRAATSAVYAIFDPDEERRSLGIFMMLESIRYSRDLGCAWYYHGYAYREPFVYDYKKRFSAVEYLRWGGGWRDLEDFGESSA